MAVPVSVDELAKIFGYLHQVSDRLPPDVYDVYKKYRGSYACDLLAVSQSNSFGCCMLSIFCPTI
jgi:hypothetical protein